MKNMRFKVGDRVRIKSIDWWNNNSINEKVKCQDWNFISDMKKYCGKTFTIEEVYKDLDCYKMSEDNKLYSWTDEMIEGLAQEYPKIAIQGDLAKGVSVIDALVALGGENEKGVIASTKHACYFIDHDGKIRSRLLENLPEGFKLYTLEEWRKENMEKENADKKELLLGLVETQKGQELIPHKDYEIKQDGDKFYLVKKKKEYPKTYEECCKILGLLNIGLCFNVDYRRFDPPKEQRRILGLMNQFYQLLICRDAYWKIAGDEMGLGKPWEPDWNNVSDKYCIYFVSGYAWSKECQTRQCPFAFPTAEMRDAFKENFDPDLEICKEFFAI